MARISMYMSEQGFGLYQEGGIAVAVSAEGRSSDELINVIVHASEVRAIQKQWSVGQDEGYTEGKSWIEYAVRKVNGIGD